jgi:hypothetical protein
MIPGDAFGRLQFRQGYGLGATPAKNDLPREINNLKEIMRQGYGLGAARICLKPQSSSLL